MAARNHSKPNEPTIVNRKARRDYHIEETLECGIELRGTEVKSVRAGQVSLAEGYVLANEHPLSLRLHGVHIAEYPPAGPGRQHEPTRVRALLAHAREIRRLTDASRQRGMTIVPLKMYFVHGRAKLLVGLGRGRQKADRRQDIAERESRREIERALSRRRR